MFIVVGVIAVVAAILWAIALLPVRSPLLARLGSFMTTAQFSPIGTPVPPYFGWILVSAPSVLAKSKPKDFRCFFVAAVSTLVLLDALEVLRSTDRIRGVRETLTVVGFVLAYLLIRQLRRQGIDPIDSILAWSWPVLVLESASTIIFRLSPSLEKAYLTSSVARFMLGQSAAKLYTTQTNNVREDFKAGGILFVNGNIASLFLGVCGLAALSAGVAGRRQLWWPLAGLLLVSTFFTGSKTGIVLTLAIPVIMWLLYVYVDGNPHPSRIPALIFGIPIIGTALVEALGFVASNQISSTTGEADDPTESAGARYEIWSAFPPQFTQSPLQGLGFGGWEASFEKYVHLGYSGGVYPPHNLFIAAWANSGVVGLALTLALFVVTVVYSLRKLRSGTLSQSQRASLCLATGCVLWILIHGQGDNTAIYGTPALTLIAAWAYEACLGRQDEETPSVSEGAERGRVLAVR